MIDILDGEEKVLSVRADAYRDDVKKAGVGTGHYGFSIPNLGQLFPLSRHRVSVRCAGDQTDLQGSPAWLIRPVAGLDTAAIDFIRTATRASANNARTPEDVNPQIAVLCGLLNDLLGARNALDESRSGGADFHLQELLLEAELSDWTRELLTKVQHDYPPLHFEVSAEPLVSIVIPVYNKFQTTYNCLKSIAENLPQASFEIILADDCSRDETLFAGFVASGNVKIVRNAQNQGFVRTCNAGAKAARGQYLFFLNNDTLVRPGWLDSLVETFDQLPNIGIVGSKLLFEDQSLQEVGGIIWRLGDGWNWGRGADPKEPRFSYLRDSDYVSGAALMIAQKLFSELNGFDELYVPAYYEDTDLCFRVREAGYRTVVQPASEIVHLEGVSAGKDVTGSGMKRYQLINHKKFYERWKATLAKHRFNGEQPDLEAERSVTRRAYFIDETVPTPNKDAGSNAALQHMLALTRLGYKVTFLPADNMANIAPYTANLQKHGIECLYAPYFWSVEEVFRKAKVKPDLVYVHRYSNASKYSSMVRLHFPECQIVYNVADLHFLRQQREAMIEGSLKGAPVVTEAAELSVMRLVNAVIVHSNVEADILRSKDSALRVHTVPWTVESRPTTTPFARRAGFAFIGGYGHRPNVDAALYLAREVIPLLQEGKRGRITGYLVGSHPPDEVFALNSEKLKVLGFVPDLSSLLHGLRCTVAPLRYGAGVKGKVLESLAHGLPCVVSEIAAEGLELPQNLHWLVAGSPADFADKIRALHEDQNLNAELSAFGLDYIAQRYSAEVVEKRLAESIEA